MKLPRVSQIALSTLLLFASAHLHAQSVFDNDGGDFLWSNPLNWSDNTLPGTNTANVTGFNTIIDADFSAVPNVNGWTSNGITTTIVDGGIINIGSNSLSAGHNGFNIDMQGGSFRAERLFTNGSLTNRQITLTISGGVFAANNRILMINTNFDNTLASSLTFSGGTLNAPGNFQIYGADADDRASLNIIGSEGSFNVGNASASGDRLTLFNTSEGYENSATDVNFAFDEDGVTTIMTGAMTLGGNALTLDFTNATNTPGVYLYDLIDYAHSVSGTFATPTFVGLDPGESAVFIHNTVDQIFQVEYTAIPEPSAGLLLIAGALAMVTVRRRRNG